jgi:hypothetical protein
MIDYVSLYDEITDKMFSKQIIIFFIALLIALVIFVIAFSICEKFLKGYNGNFVLALTIFLFSTIAIIVSINSNHKYKTEYIAYGIKSTQNFTENFEKISDEIEYRIDIPNKNEYINLILNKFYGNINISINDEEILKKLKY